MRILLYFLLFITLAGCSGNNGSNSDIELIPTFNSSIEVISKSIIEDKSFNLEIQFSFHGCNNFGHAGFVNLTPIYHLIQMGGKKDTIFSTKGYDLNLLEQTCKNGDQQFTETFQIPLEHFKEVESNYKVAVEIKDFMSDRVIHLETSSFKLVVINNKNNKNTQFDNRPYMSIENLSYKLKEYGIEVTMDAYCNPKAKKQNDRIPDISINYDVQLLSGKKEVSQYERETMLTNESVKQISFFIPYTAINLKAGRHSVNLEVYSSSFSEKRKTVHSSTITFEQPILHQLEYKLIDVEIDVEGMDKSTGISLFSKNNAGRGLGDACFSFTQHKIQLYGSIPIKHSGKIGTSAGKIQIFPNESILLTFSDADLVGKDHIASIELSDLSPGKHTVELRHNRIIKGIINYQIIK